ncbi:unnamed protein product [Staurois parvus]|uniref:Transposase Tc1-like domain-containing protein n=1 Tax=Staurois parvus TaxID=386267 RepID=A0ABN9DBJ8_9NEOB|nr:unnamed protein product [Staurois parvus]
MGRSQELSDSKRGPVIGGHLGNKSIRDISWLLNIPRSTVSGIVTKWKQLGTTATQPPSGRPRHMTGRGQRKLKRTVRRSHQLSAESIAKDLQTWCGLQMSPTTVRRELHGMGFHGRAAASKPSITKCNAKRRMPWCKARCHWTLEHGDMFSEGANYSSLSGNPMDLSGFGGCQENGTCLTALCQV